MTARYLQLNRIGIHNQVSRFRCPEAPPVYGRALYSLSHIKKIFYNPENRNLVIDYIGDSKPVTLCNISESVYNRVVDELTVSDAFATAVNTRVLTLGSDGDLVDDTFCDLQNSPPNKFSP